MDQKQKIQLLKNLIDKTDDDIKEIKELLQQIMEAEGWESVDLNQLIMNEDGEAEETGQVVEGVFDGQGMIAGDGKHYSVPANYASKSKLVEGDILKLTIRPNGNFIYKQIGPIDRDRLIGVLAKDQKSGEFMAVMDGRTYRLLLASVTYYKGKAGDKVVILVPKNGKSAWAAVENIMREAPNARLEDEDETDDDLI